MRGTLGAWLVRMEHPGRTLRKFLRSHGIKQCDLAAAVSLSQGYVSDVIRGHRDMTAMMAARLERLPGFPKGEFWLEAQSKFDLAVARRIIAASAARS